MWVNEWLPNSFAIPETASRLFPGSLPFEGYGVADGCWAGAGTASGDCKSLIERLSCRMRLCAGRRDHRASAFLLQLQISLISIFASQPLSGTSDAGPDSTIGYFPGCGLRLRALTSV